MSKITAVLGEVINITEEDLVFTNEQLKRIEELRKKSGTGKIFPRKKKKSTYKEVEPSDEYKAENWGSRNLKPGMPVTVTEEGHTFIGFVTKVHTDPWYPKFDVETIGGNILKEIDHRCVKYRIKDKYLYTGEIPEEISKLTTQHLLSELRKSRIPSESNDDWKYDLYIRQVKAELAKRPHIPTKAERKAVINHAKRNKAMKKYEKSKKKIA